MCNKPLFRLVVDTYVASIISSSFRKRVKNGALILNRADRDFMISIYHLDPIRFTSIPCGHCAGCRSDYASQWASRCMLELSTQKKGVFITLTYNDEHLNIQDVINPLTGEVLPTSVLVKSDFQKFMKRLRRHIEPLKVRVFYCGQYGDKTKRPHFHAIIFGYDFPDKIPLFFQKNGKKYRHYVEGSEPYFVSPFLSKVWGKGHCLISRVTPNNCAYVASYSVKQYPKKKIVVTGLTPELAKMWNIENGTNAQNVDILLENHLIQKPYVSMSRRPGIARDFYDEHKWDIYEYDSIRYPFQSNRNLKKHLRYFDKLFGATPDDYETEEFLYLRYLKQKRQSHMRALEALRDTDLSEEDYFRKREERMQDNFARQRRKQD